MSLSPRHGMHGTQRRLNTELRTPLPRGWGLLTILGLPGGPSLNLPSICILRRCFWNVVAGWEPLSPAQTTKAVLGTGFHPASTPDRQMPSDRAIQDDIG